MKVFICCSDENITNIVKNVIDAYFFGTKIEYISKDINISGKNLEESLLINAKKKIDSILGQDYFDLYISFEEGYIKVGGKWFFTVVCCVYDNFGYSFGFGPSLELPKQLINDMLLGEDILKILQNFSKNSEKDIIKVFTDGKLGINDMYKIALMMALSSDMINQLFEE
jgi:non-canonical (house-cleaning) NTP pyrophosphatase